MNFEEFKQATKQKNELLKEIGRTGKLFGTEMDNLKKLQQETLEFWGLNTGVFNVEVRYLTNKLDEFIKGVPKTTSVDFITYGTAAGIFFNMRVTEFITGYSEPKRVQREYTIAPITTDKHGNICANLERALNYANCLCDRNHLFSIPGFEDTLWDAVEANYKKQIEVQIGLLTKTRERNEKRKAELLEPDFITKETAKLDAETQHCEKQISAINEQLKK